MTEYDLRQALMRSLSAEMPAACRQAVLTEIHKKERCFMRNKFRFALVLTIVLMLLSSIALAVSLSRDYFEDVAHLQFESGYYEDWGLEEKREMVKILEEYGLITATEACSMTDEKSIDAFMIARYGVEGSDRIDTIGLYSILDKELGLIQTWSLEQRAWYSDMMMRTGLLKKGGDEGIFGVPQEEDVQPDEAVAIAKAAIIEAFALSENALDNHRIDLSFETDSTDWERVNLYYIINFWGDEYYWCNVTRDGRVMDSTMDKWSLSPAEQVERIREQEAREAAKPKGPIEQWSLADKAAWIGGNNALPGENDITESEAISIARRRLASIGYELPDYDVCVWYRLRDYDDDNSTTNDPFYAVYFIDDLDAPIKSFCVLIDADTGEILDTMTPDNTPSNG